MQKNYQQAYPTETANSDWNDALVRLREFGYEFVNQTRRRSDNALTMERESHLQMQIYRVGPIQEKTQIKASSRYRETFQRCGYIFKTQIYHKVTTPWCTENGRWCPVVSYYRFKCVGEHGQGCYVTSQAGGH